MIQKKKKISVMAILLLSFLLIGCGSIKNASYYYKEGIKAFENEDYVKANDMFFKAVDKNPEKAEYYIAYGMSLIKTDEIKKAIQQFDKAILDKENKIVLENNKKAYRGKGIAYYQINQYGKAIKAFDEALKIRELADWNQDILSYKADAENQSGKYDLAVQSYTELIKQGKKDADIYIKRGRMHQRLGNNKEALSDYDKAISLNKNKYEYYIEKYGLYKSLGDNDGGSKTLTEALSIKPKTKEDQFYIGMIHFYQEDYATAKEEFNALISQNYMDAYYFLGQINELEADYPSALNNYLTYTKSEQGLKSAEAFNALGYCYLKTEEYKKALAAFETGLQINDKNWDRVLRHNEISALERLSQFDKAFNKAKEFLELYPDDKEMMKEYEFIKTRINKKKSK